MCKFTKNRLGSDKICLFFLRCGFSVDWRTVFGHLYLHFPFLYYLCALKKQINPTL